MTGRMITFGEYRENLKEHLKYLRKEMRDNLTKSEAARDKYYEVQAAYEAEGLVGYALEAALRENRDAQTAVANSVLYDRWTTKYAMTLQAELALYEFHKEPA